MNDKMVNVEILHRVNEKLTRWKLLALALVITLVMSWLLEASQTRRIHRLEHSLELRDELIEVKKLEQDAAVKLGMITAIVETKRFFHNTELGSYDSFTMEERQLILRFNVQAAYNDRAQVPIYFPEFPPK